MWLRDAYYIFIQWTAGVMAALYAFLYSIPTFFSIFILGFVPFFCIATPYVAIPRCALHVYIIIDGLSEHFCFNKLSINKVKCVPVRSFFL